MIIVRSPLRITLGGGGTDLPSYYRDHGGFLVAAAINQYVYVTLVRTPLEEIILRYSKIERGKQDQYIAAFGGATVFEFNQDDSVSARPVKASDETLDLLEDSLVMVSTGF